MFEEFVVDDSSITEKNKITKLYHFWKKLSNKIATFVRKLVSNYVLERHCSGFKLYKSHTLFYMYLSMATDNLLNGFTLNSSVKITLTCAWMTNVLYYILFFKINCIIPDKIERAPREWCLDVLSSLIVLFMSSHTSSLLKWFCELKCTHHY